MTPVTPVQTINNTNNNSRIKGKLAWIQTDNDEDDYVFAHVTITMLGLKSGDVSELDDWMKYYQYSFLQDIISEYFSSPHDLQLHPNYKKNGMPIHCPNLLSHDSKLLLDEGRYYINKIMVKLLPLTYLYPPKQTLTISRSTPLCCSLQLPTHLGLQEHPPLCFQACLTFKSPSSTSRREPRGIYPCIPPSRETSTMTLSITPSLPPPGHKALGIFLTPYSVPSIATPLFSCMLNCD